MACSTFQGLSTMVYRACATMHHWLAMMWQSKVYQSSVAMACSTSPGPSSVLHTLGGKLCSSRRGLIVVLLLLLLPFSARHALRRALAEPALAPSAQLGCQTYGERRLRLDVQPRHQSGVWQTLPNGALLQSSICFRSIARQGQQLQASCSS